MIYSFLYVLVFTFASILIQKMYFSVSPLFSLLITASIATIYFNAINVKNLKAIYAHCCEFKWAWLGIMITILVMWNCSMITPGLIGASLYNFIYFSWLGMLGFISLSLLNWKDNQAKFYFGICIFILIAIIVADYLSQHTSSHAVVGIILSFIGGTSSFVYFKQSQFLTKNAKLTATQILAVRFYLTIIVMVVLLPKNSFSLYFTPHNMLLLALLGFLSLIIPLYFLQKALEKISSEQNAIIISLAPVTTALLQELIFKDVNPYYVIVYLLYSGIVATAYLFSRRKLKGTTKK